MITPVKTSIVTNARPWNSVWSLPLILDIDRPSREEFIKHDIDQQGLRRATVCGHYNTPGTIHPRRDLSLNVVTTRSVFHQGFPDLGHRLVLLPLREQRLDALRHRGSRREGRFELPRG